MKKVLLALVLMVGMTVTLNGHFTYVWDKVAVATTPTPVPCQFAGYDQAGGLYNTSIVCATPSTGPGAGTPAAGTCIGVATPPAAGTISYTCSTPGPQATPSPSATSTSTAGPPSAVWSGSWPYTLQVKFPSGGGGGCTTNCLLKSSTSTWDSVACGETSATHCYPMTGPVGTGAGDCQSDTPTGTALPSPVPLATPTTSSSIVCGAPGISNDGETSVQFPGSGNGYLIVPAVAWPGSGASNASIEVLTKLEIPNTNSPVASTFSEIWSDDNQVGDMATSLYNNSSNYWTHAISLGGTTTASIDSVASDVPTDIIYTWDGTNSKLYFNGVLTFSSTGTPTWNNGTPGYLCSRLASGPLLCYGRMAKFATYNATLTQTQIFAHVAALGL